MSIFKKPYELIENAPKALDWGVLRIVFEWNLAFLPGAFGIYSESGHSPYNNALITQPLLHGLTSKILDFLWVASDSGTIWSNLYRNRNA